MLGRRLGAQKVLVPRLVGEDDFYRYTVKEIDAGNYEVIRVFELSHVGDREGIFGFIPLVLGELEKEKKRETVRKRPARNPVIRIWSWEEFRRDFGSDPELGEFSGAPKAKAEAIPEVTVVRPAEQGFEEVRPALPKKSSVPGAVAAQENGRRAAEMVALGKVASFNGQWGFCVIDMTGRKLKETELVEIRDGESKTVYATLVVTRVEGNKAIADLADGQRGKRLFPGDVVFGSELR